LGGREREGWGWREIVNESVIVINIKTKRRGSNREGVGVERKTNRRGGERV